MFSNIIAGAAGFPVADLGDNINQSLRFPSSTGPSLSRTMGTGDSRKKFTVSVWVKRGKIPSGDQNHIWNYHANPNVCALGFNGNKLRFYHYDSSGTFNAQYVSSAVFRDTSAWYHIVASVDTTLSSATDRVKLWVNGTRITSFDTQTTFSQNYDTHVGVNNYTALIGIYADGSSFKFGGYVANKYFLDGITASETDFGRYQEDGVWVPKNYTGTYGTNGFHLDFADSSDLGNDVSGNNNDFTVSGFDTAAISSSNTDNDVDYNDTPTSNYATLNSLVAYSSGTFSNANLAYNTSTLSAYAVGTMAMKEKCYWETEITSGAFEVGLADITDTSADSYLGGTGGDTHAYGSNGQILTGAVASSTQATYTTGDIIGHAYDPDTGKWWVAKNGTWQNSGNPAAGTGQVATVASASRSTMAPAVGPYGGTHAINYGQMPFVYTAPSGFNALQTNNLPEPTIKNGKEHFDVLTWSGTNSSNTITGLDFQPDFVWVKKRNGSESHRLADVIRGSTKGLASNSNAAESDTSGSISSFNSNGITVVDAGQTNESGFTYVAWCWKAGGTAVSNTDGTITSSVSANTDSGFSIITWTGTGANGSYGHGLDKAPEFIIHKRRDSTSDWHVYHESIGGSPTNDVIYLNLTNAANTGNNNVFRQDPDANVIYTGSAGSHNTSNATYVDYAWHSVEGFSKFGTYEGNGTSGGGPFVYTGHKPHLLIIKSADVGGDWVMLDTTRTPNNPNEAGIKGNGSIAEGVDSNYTVDFLSNGFKIRNNGDADLNSSGQTYIFMSWAENPFGGENAAPATAR